ncbi:hypothetical protein IWW55_004910, partial [Coemansia sp. RSA 2706]
RLSKSFRPWSVPSPEFGYTMRREIRRLCPCVHRNCAVLHNSVERVHARGSRGTAADSAQECVGNDNYMAARAWRKQCTAGNDPA